MVRPALNRQPAVHLECSGTEVPLDLPSGKHRLQLLLGDEDQEPQAPPLISKPIRITVRSPRRGGMTHWEPGFN